MNIIVFHPLLSKNLRRSFMRIGHDQTKLIRLQNAQNLHSSRKLAYESKFSRHFAFQVTLLLSNIPAMNGASTLARHHVAEICADSNFKMKKVAQYD